MMRDPSSDTSGQGDGRILYVLPKFTTCCKKCYFTAQMYCKIFFLYVDLHVGMWKKQRKHHT